METNIQSNLINIRKKMCDIEQIVKRVRSAPEVDMPLDLMADISALCRAAESAIPALDLLQVRLEAGCYIRQQDDRWCLFDASGSGITSGTTIRSMLINLIFTDC